MELTANNIKSVAEMTLLTIQPSKKGEKSHFFKDFTLKHLSFVNVASLPGEKDLRREIKKRVNLCAAVDERKRSHK